MRAFGHRSLSSARHFRRARIGPFMMMFALLLLALMIATATGAAAAVAGFGSVTGDAAARLTISFRQPSVSRGVEPALNYKGTR